MSGWTARELARKTKQAPATVASWVQSGLITPEVFGRGRGGHIIGISGLFELLSVIDLRDAGFSTQAIRQAVENLRRISGQERPLARLTIVVDGKDIHWKDAHDISGVTISALHTPGQRLMVFHVGERHSEMLHQLETSAQDTPDESRLIAEKELSHVA